MNMKIKMEMKIGKNKTLPPGSARQGPGDGQRQRAHWGRPQCGSFPGAAAILL